MAARGQLHTVLSNNGTWLNWPQPVALNMIKHHICHWKEMVEMGYFQNNFYGHFTTSVCISQCPHHVASGAMVDELRLLEEFSASEAGMLGMHK